MPNALCGAGIGAAGSLQYTLKVRNLAPIAYWPLAEASGSVATDESGNGRSGTYSNVTLGAVGIGDGRTAATFVPASNSLCNVYGASFAGAWNGAEGTFAAWAIVSGSGVWADATDRKIGIFLSTGSNFVQFRKTGTNNTLQGFYNANGVNKSVSFTTSTTAWFHIAIIWSASADQVKVYFNGAQQGTTQTGLGVYAGALSSTQTLLGCGSTTPANIWSGNLAHAAVWASALSAAQIATLAVVS